MATEETPQTTQGLAENEELKELGISREDEISLIGVACSAIAKDPLYIVPDVTIHCRKYPRLNKNSKKIADIMKKYVETKFITKQTKENNNNNMNVNSSTS